MRAWLIDAYRSRGRLVLWLRAEENIRLERNITGTVYLEATEDAERFLKANGLPCCAERKRDYMGRPVPVFALSAPVSGFEKFISWIERGCRHRVAMYNADIKPEQMFLYERRLRPFTLIDTETLCSYNTDACVQLTKAEISVEAEADLLLNPALSSITINSMRLAGGEHELLMQFADEFRKLDPDVILIERAFLVLPYLDKKLREQGIGCCFHRWDPVPIRYRGGKTFHSYMSVSFREFAIRLHGRFLVDTFTMVASECDTDGIIELCQLSGTLFQQVASRSFGAVFQQSLVRKMVEQGCLVPYKEKPVDEPLSMQTLLKADRVGHTFDPKPGFHMDVAEIDFSSMYPWIMFNRNISAETILSGKGPFEKVPGLPIRISLARKGLVPQAIKALLEQRMHYKRNPSTVNKARASGLKWVLVTSYGYCRFREFKLGISTSHMAIGAFAREITLEAARLAEQRGFEVVHGIIDSLYIKKKGMQEQEVRELCDELEQATGIPVSFEGMFRWIVFMNSINDVKRPVPVKYFGVFTHGGIKARGIEVRQRSAPMLVRRFQKEALLLMAQCSSRVEIVSRMPELAALLKKHISRIDAAGADELMFRIRISKTDYDYDIPQRAAVLGLKKKGLVPRAGQVVRYVLKSSGAVLAEEYDSRPDVQAYAGLLERALFIILQPFGLTRKTFAELMLGERQSLLKEFQPVVKHVYIHSNMPKERRGLSEKIIRRRLERQGWTVWRGGLVHITGEDELYPNVRRKYLLLERLLETHTPGMLDELSYLCRVHHGMPDLLCFRKGIFKFVECKLIYEQLSRRQKRCISRLQQLGFAVEVHKLVDHRTKARVADVNLLTMERAVIVRQATLKTPAHKSRQPLNTQKTYLLYGKDTRL